MEKTVKDKFGINFALIKKWFRIGAIFFYLKGISFDYQIITAFSPVMIITDQLTQKIEVLANAARYDVSCSSSGSNRQAKHGELGNAARSGICHSFTPDGRCISLLKILFTNHCIYDCAYCINRKSNDISRTSFKVKEIVDLTINFYRRNYIEGLFLSSGVMVSPDYTMERLMAVVKTLRNEHHFNGYIHLKAIPGASNELIQQAGLYADRLSVNIEIPSEPQLKLLAPDKDYQSVFSPMTHIHNQIAATEDERKKLKKVPRFVPAGQSTQLIVGASADSDYEILKLASGLYGEKCLIRVYYSGYVPINRDDARLPALASPPLVRENRIYQADWLMRFYGFQYHEIVDKANPSLDLRMDPKLAWAFRNPQFFPVDLNIASYEDILRVPGIGVKSARLIVANRRFGSISYLHLKKLGIAINRAKYFILCRELPVSTLSISPIQVRQKVLRKAVGDNNQLSLF